MVPWQPPVLRPAGWRSDAQRKKDSDQRRARDPGYRARKALYNSKAWKNARLAKLIDQPLCEDCLAEGRTVQAVHVDHEQAVAAGGATLDWKNFRSLCKSHHSRKTAARDGGYGNPRTGVER